MKKIITIIVSISIAFSLSSCLILEEVAKEMPTVESTYVKISDVNAAMQDVMRMGETTFDFNIADVTEDDLAHIADNMSTFWGEPREYMITSIYQDIEDIIPNRAVDIMSVTNTFELSNNYYVYENIRNAVPIPEDQPRALEIANALKSVRGEIFLNSDGTEYGDTLAAHDWLIANLEYDETIEEYSDHNGSYGALVSRKTMCQGYAEALELILRCYTDVNVIQIVGEAKNDNEIDPSLDWVGHAWNAVQINGEWMHVDATFNDPKGNPEGQLSHFYFAQNDMVMLDDHRWTAGYFPICDGEDFFYFRNIGLFVPDFESFEGLIRILLTDANPEQMEIAATDVVLDEENVQFIFKLNNNIEEVHWSIKSYGNINVIIIAPVYYDEGAE